MARGDKLATRESLLRQKLVDIEGGRESADAARVALGARLADEQRARAAVEAALEHAEARVARRTDELACLRSELDPLITRHVATVRRVKEARVFWLPPCCCGEGKKNARTHTFFFLCGSKLMVCRCCLLCFVYSVYP